MVRKMVYYTVKDGCVSIVANYYPPQVYRIYRKELRKRKDSIALYIHDQINKDRSVIIWITVNQRLCVDSEGGDSDD